MSLSLSKWCSLLLLLQTVLFSSFGNCDVINTRRMRRHARAKRQTVPFLTEILNSLLFRSEQTAVFETTGDLARMAGYDVEEHPVTTQDGYILTLHRLIPPHLTQRELRRNSYEVIQDRPQPPYQHIHKKTTHCVNCVHIHAKETNPRHLNSLSNQPWNSVPSYNISGTSFLDRLHRFITRVHLPPVEKRSGNDDNNGELSQRETVFLQHGLMGSSDNWNTNKKEHCLAYLLSDAGYDVWMGNFRGNVYSRGHVNMTHLDPGYWAFSYDEMAEHDLPAMLNYVMDTTARKRPLHYIGHSMGSTVFFAAMASQPSLQHHVASMVALAPVATVTAIKSPIKYLAPIAAELQRLLNLFGSYDNLLTNRLLTSLWDHYRVCKSSRVTCQNLQFFITGFDPDRADQEMVPMIMSHNPAGSSTGTLFHFGQGVASGKFMKFDWGVKENRKKYGQDAPPEYDLTKITVPVALYAAPNDWMIGAEDVSHLESVLPLHVVSHWIQNPEFSHLDFLWARDAKSLVYDKILDHLQSFTSAYSQNR